MLRWRTWLSPGIPYAFFEFVAAAVSGTVGHEWVLDADETVSGPPPGFLDPFGAGVVDLGFLCAPSYRALAAEEPTTVQLVGAAPVWADPRNAGKPQYFAELVVAGASTWGEAGSLADLAGARFGMNDTASKSGWRALVGQAESLGLDESFLGAPITTGGHLQSLEWLARGDLDAATIDSNTLIALGGLPDGLRVVETLGPFPIQPIAAAATLDADLVGAVGGALLGSPEKDLIPFGVVRFGPVSAADYDEV